jgi:hypothetical protein
MVPPISEAERDVSHAETEQASRAIDLPVRAIVTFCLMYASLLATVLIAFPMSSYLWKLASVPNAIVLVYCAVFLVVAWMMGQLVPALSPSRQALILGVLWAAIYWIKQASPLGDDWLHQVRMDEPQQVCALSEPLSEWLLLRTFESGAWRVTAAFSPLAGLLSSVLVLMTLFELIPTNRFNAWRFFSIWLFAANGIHLVFFKGYLETPQLAYPAALASVYLLVRYLKQHQPWTFVLSALFYSIACLLHGAHTFWFPIFILIPLYQIWVARSHTLTRFLFAPAALAALGWGVGLLSISSLLGCGIFLGAAAGGADGKMFVPIAEITSRFERYVFFSSDHFIEVASIASLVGLFLFMILPVFWRHLYRGVRSEDLNRAPLLLLMMLLFLAHCTLISLWNFDLGFPTDYDLMTSLGLLSIGLPLVILMEVLERPTASVYGLLFTSHCLSWALISRFLLR